MVTYQNTSLYTNGLSVYVLPPLVAGVLDQVDSVCVNDNAALEFLIDASGGEWNWGGFSDFSYQWQQGNIGNIDISNPPPVNWINVGDDLDTHILNVAEGEYYFRCFITSLHGCGTVITDPVFVQVYDCSNSSMGEYIAKKTLFKKINILGQSNQRNSLIINIYTDGFVEKKYIIE